MFKRIRREGGFTLVELLVVLAILAILIAVVVPNLTGFLGRGKESSFEADKDTIQAAVDAYYTGGAATRNKWPTHGGGTGIPNDGAASYIDFEDLTTHRYLEAAPTSSGSSNPNGLSGSYGWYVDAQGLVKAGNDDDGTGYNGNYP